MVRPELPTAVRPSRSLPSPKLVPGWETGPLAPQIYLCFPVGPGAAGQPHPLPCPGAVAGVGGTQVKREPRKGFLPFEFKEKRGKILLVKSEYPRIKSPPPPFILIHLKCQKGVPEDR